MVTITNQAPYARVFYTDGTNDQGSVMRMIGAVFLMAVLLYQLYAIPLGLVAAFFITRSLMKRHTRVTAAWITLAWTVPIFAPLVLTSRTFFGGTYAPWYAALALMPPTPEFSAGGLVITVGVSLFGSILAAIVAAR